MFKQLNLLPAGFFAFLFLAINLCGACSPTRNSKKSAAIISENSSQKVSRGFDVKTYSLQLWINFSDSTIRGTNSIKFLAAEDLDSITIDLFPQFNVQKIVYAEREIDFRRDSNKIHIYFPEKILRGEKSGCNIYYSGKPVVAVKPPWEGGFIWEKDSLGRPWAAVACEQLGASSWWPCKEDWSDEPDSFFMQFFVPKGMFCVSNGNLTDVDDADQKFTAYSWKVTYPINLYNITFNAGYYKHFIDTFTSEYKNVNSKLISYPIDYYFLDYNLNKAKAFFADSIYARTKIVLRAFEKYFGVYPFYRDGYALVETPYWGMEHQSAVAYGNNFKLNLFGFDFILVHESGHEWWGNAVTASDEGDMWIHESFTTYAEALYVEYIDGYQKSIEYLQMQKSNIANQNPVQGPRNVHFHDRADNDIYYKGSWMLHTLRSVLNNDSLWFSMIFGLQQEFQYKTIATEDIIAYMEKHSGKDLKAFFAQYLYESKLPVLQYWVENKNGKPQLKYRWLGVVEGFEMPLEIEVKGRKYRLQPNKKFQYLLLEDEALTRDVKVDLGRFLVEVLGGI